MKKLAVFLVVLLMLLPLTAFAEESDISSVPEETPVEVTLRNSLSATPRDSILLIGGNTSALWKDFVFDMYPGTAKIITVEETLSADWTAGFNYLAMLAPKTVVYCVEGNDTAEDVLLLAQGLVQSLSGAKIYFVSAIVGENTADINTRLSEYCASYTRLNFVDVYSAMLTEEGTLDPAYAGEKLTSAGVRFMGKTVSAEINGDTPVIAPEVSETETSEDEEAQPKKRSYKWLIPVAILVVGLIIGIDYARPANEREKRRRAGKQ